MAAGPSAQRLIYIEARTVEPARQGLVHVFDPGDG
jgi:hypothetical protein